MSTISGTPHRTDHHLPASTQEVVPAGLLLSTATPLEARKYSADPGLGLTTAPRLSVVVPAFNEEQHLRGTIDALIQTLESARLTPYEIIIVDDGSTDGTSSIATSIASKRDHVRVITYPRNRGKGHALKVGFKAALGTRVAFIDADREIDPINLVTLHRQMEATGAPIAVGRKIVTSTRPTHRRVMSWVLFQLNQLLFRLPVRDSQTGIKMFDRKDLLLALDDCRENGYLFDLELLAIATYRGLRITEVPVEVTMVRESRIGMRAGFRALLGMMSLRQHRIGNTP